MPIGHGEFNLLGRRGIGKTLREKKCDHAYILPKIGEIRFDSMVCQYTTSYRLER
ncbi:hypothetical protein P4S64_23170 [Vibrio sp. M60_M31a]